MLMFARFNQIPEVSAFLQIAAVSCGGLVCFLCFNSNKASVFMGDTGSLYLGSLIALLSFFSFLGLFLIIIGVMFVVSSVSDILQVAYFKFTKRKSGVGKRIFLMAPFHHHLEKKGWAEAKIVALYSIITVLAGMVCVLSLL
jgi:phospho-N-acetylmuramoyl-pentapeptide-transferase